MKKFMRSICFILTVAIMLSCTLMSNQGNNLIKKPGNVFSSGDKSVVSADQEIEQDRGNNLTAYDNISENTEKETEKYETAEDKKLNQNLIKEEQAQPSEVKKANPLYNYKPGAEGEIETELNELDANSGMLTDAHPVNTYVFPVRERGSFTYTFSHESTKKAGGWNVSLYQEYYINGVSGEKGWRLINVLSCKEADTAKKTKTLGLIKGEYRLVVTAQEAMSYLEFSIKTKFTPGASWETECNDNIYRYTEIYSGVPLKGSASNLPGMYDNDWFMFRMPAGGCASLSFTHVKTDGVSVAWQVILYDEQGRELYSDNSTMTDTEISSGKIGLPAGNYYIAVKNKVYTSLEYELKFLRSSEMRYETEFNDSPETSEDIGLQGQFTGSLTSRLNGIDRDYFRFTLNEKGSVSLEFRHVPEKLQEDEIQKKGWRIKLYDEKLQCLYTGYSAWDDDIISTPPTGLGAGTYYVEISGDNLYLNSSDYILAVFIGSDEKWESEPNNSFETANPIGENSEKYGFLSENGVDYDSDFYMFILDSAKDVSVILGHDNLGYHKDIFSFTLYNEDHNRVGYVNDSGETVFNTASYADEQKTETKYISLPAGTYYLKVTNGIFFDNIRYSVLFKSS